jgi:hypothetical protein
MQQPDNKKACCKPGEQPAMFISVKLHGNMLGALSIGNYQLIEVITTSAK